jgi:hypothetical protein
MTKVTLSFPLTRPLTDCDLDNIANVHSTYGMARVRVAPALDSLTVDYDASRLTKQDVEAELTRHGLPIHGTVAAE